jgi:small subunit ribosomal protein S15
MLDKKAKAELVKKYGKNEKDTGSIEFQIALLTQQIKDLTEHLLKNDKDTIARRGLLVKVGRRRALLAYLEGYDRERYIKLLGELELRK